MKTRLSVVASTRHPGQRGRLVLAFVGIPLVVARCGLHLGQSATRGKSVPEDENRGYACENYPDCDDEPILKSQYRKDDDQYCRVHHGLRMIVPVIRDPDGNWTLDESTPKPGDK
jgi:hypothetical protein